MFGLRKCVFSSTNLRPGIVHYDDDDDDGDDNDDDDDDDDDDNNNNNNNNNNPEKNTGKSRYQGTTENGQTGH
jgi:hypothetical protein